MMLPKAPPPARAPAGHGRPIRPPPPSAPGPRPQAPPQPGQFLGVRHATSGLALTLRARLQVIQLDPGSPMEENIHSTDENHNEVENKDLKPEE